MLPVPPSVCLHSPYCCSTHRARQFWCQVCNSSALFPEHHAVPACAFPSVVAYPPPPHPPPLPSHATALLLAQQTAAAGYAVCASRSAEPTPVLVAANCPSSCAASSAPRRERDRCRRRR